MSPRATRDAKGAIDAAAKDGAAKKVASVTVNAKTVTAKAVAAAVERAGGDARYVTEVALGKKVRKVKARALSGLPALKTLVVKTKKLTMKSVRKSLNGSKVRAVKVKVGGKKVKVAAG